MDAQLFAIFDELAATPTVRAIGSGEARKSWSSGRDVSAIGTNVTEMTHHELMSRAMRASRRSWSIEAPIIVAIQGWAIGGSFQRARLCDVRIAAEDARFMLPELGHGVIPDTGGMGAYEG